MDKKFATGLAFGISGIWAVVTIASMLAKDYTALEVITPVMLIVAGFAFGYPGIKK